MTDGATGDSSALSHKDDQTAKNSEEIPLNVKVAVEAMKQLIWKRRPILGNIMQKRGEKTLFDYAKDFLDVNTLPGLDERKKEVVEVVEDLLKGRIGEDVAKEVATQLRKLPLVSTADHHAPIDHPFWVNANIIFALPIVANDDVHLKYLINFSFASVSVNNTSGFPRGILFHSGVDGSNDLIRLPFLPDKLKMGVVVRMQTFTSDDINKALSVLAQKERDGEVSSEKADGVRMCINKYFNIPEVLNSVSLASQITKINYRMWRDLFHSASGEVCKNVPDLIYLEIEKIVSKLLFEKHLNNPESLIYKFLFDKGSSSLVYKHFEKIHGAFSVKAGWGSYMFWATDDKFYRVALMLKNGKLQSQDGCFSFDWDPESITVALRDKKIFPSMLLCYVLISLYYGIKCLGGFSQVNDLTLTKYAWREYLEEVGMKEEADNVENVQTKELGGDGMALVYMKSGAGKLMQATGIDMILEKGDTSFEKYIELSKRITLNQAMEPMLPEMYEVLYSQKDRDPQLDAIVSEQILENSELVRKIEGLT